jgi:hypothetical protein
MPAEKEFLGGFGIHERAQYGQYQIQSISIEHISVKRYREYKYPIKIIFTPILTIPRDRINPRDSYQAFLNSIAGTKIIYSDYGNPYECNIDEETVELDPEAGNIIAQLMGHSYRV